MAARVAREAARKPVLKLAGPFAPYRSGGSDEIDVERDVRVESPELLSALTAAAKPGHEVGADQMDGPHVFTVKGEFTLTRGSPGGWSSPPEPDECTLDDQWVVAIDGMELRGAGDVQVASAVVELTDSERERAEEAYAENHEEDFDPPDYDD